MLSLSCSRPTLGRVQPKRGGLARPTWGLFTAARRVHRILAEADGSQPGPDGTSGGAASRPQGPQATPPWEKEPVGDGRDELRQRLREHTRLGQEQKLQLVRQKLREEETLWLERFESSGNLLARDSMHSLWESTSEQLQLLQLDPDEFIRKHGAYHGLKAEAPAAAAGADLQAPAQQKIQQFKPRRFSVVQQLQQEREKLRESEQFWLERFESASKEGKEEEQATAQARWRDARQNVQLLDRFPLLYRAVSPVAGDVWGPLLLALSIFLFLSFVMTVFGVFVLLCGLIS